MTEPEREPMPAEGWRLLNPEEAIISSDEYAVPCLPVRRRYELPEELKAARERIAELEAKLSDRDKWIDELEARLSDRDKRIKELEAQIPPPLTDAELAELTRSSEKLYNAEARVAELESSNGYPLAAEWRGKCEAARAKIAELEAQLAEARGIIHRTGVFIHENITQKRSALMERIEVDIEDFLARTAPTSDKPEPPAQERTGDSHTSVRQELHDITSPGSESVTTAAGPKTERCPHCNCSSIHKEQDRDDEGNVTNEWAECLYCGEQWSWRDKQKAAAGLDSESVGNPQALGEREPPAAVLCGATFDCDDGTEFRCTKERGHGGDHRDRPYSWKNDTPAAAELPKP